MLNLKSRFAALLALAIVLCSGFVDQLSSEQLFFSMKVFTITGFTPQQGAQGQFVTINVTGTGMKAGTTAAFVPATGITVLSVTPVSPTQMKVAIKIDASATLGARTFSLNSGNSAAPAPGTFTVTAAQTTPPGNTVMGAPSGNMAVKSFSPIQGAQGQSLTISFYGTKLHTDTSVSFRPSGGITVTGESSPSASQLDVSIQIADDAPLGGRTIAMQSGNVSITIPGTFTVTQAAGVKITPPGLDLPRPVILRVTPNQIAAGSQNIELTLQGKTFAPGAQVSFSGTGIMTTSGTQYVNDTEIHVKVSVLDSAAIGGRDVIVKNPNTATGTGKGMVAITAAKKKLVTPSAVTPVPKIAPATLAGLKKGKIYLEKPAWGKCGTGEFNDCPIPLLDDSLVFEWDEENPGVADYYEIRFYAKGGKNLLMTQKIQGSYIKDPDGKQVWYLPNYYRPSAQVMTQLISTTAASYPQVVNPGASSTPDVTHGQYKLSQADIQWEVAGFQVFKKNGTAATPSLKASFSLQQPKQLVLAGSSTSQPTVTPVSQTTTTPVPAPSASKLPPTTADADQATATEVEISEKWALKRPKAPTGLSCPVTGKSSGLQLANAEEKIGNDPNNYPGDRVFIAGNFDLSGSPWKPIATENHDTPPPVQGPYGTQGVVGNLVSVKLDNVFIDWGDGWVLPITAPVAKQEVENYGRDTKLSFPTDATNPLALVHKYDYTGSYTIRIYEVAADDVQHTSPLAISASVNNLGNQPYFKLANALMGGSNSAPGSPAPASSSSSSANLGSSGNLPYGYSLPWATAGGTANEGQTKADRSYMIYCSQWVVTERMDPDATGPLHLKKLEITGFPSHDPKPLRVADPAKVVGGVKGPANIPNQKGPATPAMAAQANASVNPNATLPQPIVKIASASKQQAPTQSVKPGLAASVSASAITGSIPANIASCSQCDESMLAAASLHYYGTGKIKLQWTVNGMKLPQGETISIEPSQRRTGLGRDKSKWPEIIVTRKDGFYSPALPHNQIGVREVRVDATVVPDLKVPNISKTIAGVVQALGSENLSSAAVTAQLNKSLGGALNPQLSGLGAKSKPVPKMGFLSPNKMAMPGQPTVMYVNDIAPAAKDVSRIDFEQIAAVSQPAYYRVTESDPSAPCTFLFPTKHGDFHVTGLEGRLTKNSDGTYTGTGNLIFYLPAGNSSVQQYPPVSVSFQNWGVPDGVKVQSGSIDVSPTLKIETTPGLNGTVDKLSATAGNDMMATLTLEVKDNTLRIPGATEIPPKWPNVTSVLSADGDWYKSGLVMPRILIGWSSFQVESKDVRIDLSHSEGSAPAAKCGAPTKAESFVGMHLGNATVLPYTMGLVTDKNPLTPSVNDWTIAADSLCGHLSTGAFDAPLSDGSLHFDSIEFDAGKGTYTALYKNMKIKVPWLNITLQGDAKLVSGGGKDPYIAFPFTNITPVHKDYGDVQFTADNLKFEHQENLGWAVTSNTSYKFKAEGKNFAQFATPIIYGMDGHPYFEKAGTTRDVSLSGGTYLGDTALDLVSVHLTAPKSKPEILLFEFATKAHLSEVMPAADVQVNYAIRKSGSDYSGTTAWNSPFTMDIGFPAANPTVNTSIKPVYNGDADTKFYGDVDLGMFGGSPVRAEFLLGYESGHDYWMTKASIPLGSSGVSIYPPYLSLYAIYGGLGHNFALDAFKSAASIKNATPTFDNSFLFMAGMRVGSSDSFAYMLDGLFTVKIGGSDQGARMDYHAWLLKSQQTGEGDFQGYFQYAASNFDGELWGKLEFLGDMAKIEIPKGAASMHFGGGNWHIYAGRKEGPRIKGTILTETADSYMMLGNDVGFAIGGSRNIYLGVGDSSVASAYVKGFMDIGLQVTPQPKLIGDFAAGVSAGVCALGCCVDGGVNAAVHAEALPLDIRAKASLDLPWPLPDVSFSVHL